MLIIIRELGMVLELVFVVVKGYRRSLLVDVEIRVILLSNIDRNKCDSELEVVVLMFVCGRLRR
ncbi:hypothetical protein [Bacillus sp. YBsi01]|uniref:hypothetical protein n=1 Tax=Bacillus sp. YBsi01 TaxID=3139388 RepID=UPI00313923E9